MIVIILLTRRNRIVVVDDEPDLARLFSDGLNSAGFKTKAFADSHEAIEYIMSHKSEVNLVMTDWKMPKTNGFELTKIVSDIDNAIKVMLMSAYELEQDQLKEVNMDDYLRKPIHIAKLIETVKNELAEPQELSKALV
jgi:CheY-like chemotaxis protein